MSADVLADVLSVTRLGSAMLAQAELVGPWGLLIDPMSEAAIHVVQRGSCWLRLHNQRIPVRLNDGDLVLIRSGIAHSIADAPDTPVRRYETVLAGMPARLAKLPAARRHETTVVLCAKYLFQHHGPHPLISLLPALIHVRADEAASDPRLQLMLQLLRLEAIRPESGSELVVPRLVDTLLVFVIRSWLARQPAGSGGWFGALRDPSIAQALSLMHDRPAAPWSLASLAKACAQSRATFARRFSELVGEPPGTYLTRWRLCLAAKLLVESERSLEQIAEAIGYASAAAFSKAFSRQYGCAPGQFRARNTRRISEPPKVANGTAG
jgi:AraC-like DNA-binding protein